MEYFVHPDLSPFAPPHYHHHSLRLTFVSRRWEHLESLKEPAPEGGPTGLDLNSMHLRQVRKSVCAAPEINKWKGQ